MKSILPIAFVAALAGCTAGTMTLGDSITTEQLESFFRAHKVEGNHVVALKKRSLGVVAYLATIHGYPDNLSVCEELMVPYNKDSSGSVVPGAYYCEELR